MLAALRGDCGALSLLLEHGANVNCSVSGVGATLMVLMVKVFQCESISMGFDCKRHVYVRTCSWCDLPVTNRVLIII